MSELFVSDIERNQLANTQGQINERNTSNSYHNQKKNENREENENKER